MSVMTKDDYPVKWVRAKNLSVVWREAQRGLDPRKVQRIAENFDPDAVGVVIATLPNGTGTHHIIDGQHRVEAIRHLWGDNTFVPCQVIEKKDPAEAAEVWLKINSDRTRPSAIERFRAKVTAGRDAAVEINELLNDMGYTVAANGDDGVISAISTVEQIHDRIGLDGLRRTLLLIRSVWGMGRDAYQATTLKGFGRFVEEFGGDADMERVAEKIAKKYTPAQFIGAVRAARDFNQSSMYLNAAELIRKAYNHRLRSEDRKLDGSFV